MDGEGIVAGGFLQALGGASSGGCQREAVALFHQRGDDHLQGGGLPCAGAAGQH